jgi:hypothetical protein
MRWVHVLGMDKEWERADVDAEVTDGKIIAKTNNVSAIQFDDSAGAGIKEVVLDGTTLPAAWGKSGLLFQKQLGRWTSGYSATDGMDRRKTRAICGPIDHAFMSNFIMVYPTGKAINSTVGMWEQTEWRRAAVFWRATFRGDAPIKSDVSVNDDDITHANLIVWGDPSSNAFLKRILDKLPIKWNAQKLEFGGETYDSADHAPILVFPNPLNPEHYVVLNSGVTFRDKALANNADQTPKLPDWAIVDLRTPPGPQWPGEVVKAGFFNEKWKLE